MLRSVFFSVAFMAVAAYAATTYLAGHFTGSQQASLGSTSPLSQFLPSPPPPASVSHGFGEMQIPPDASGNYLVDAEIEGHPIRMMVDTGATYVSLTNEDASAIGLRPAPADYRYRTMTANGVGVAAKVQIGTLRLGEMEFYNVEAFVMPQGALGTSLLGMSALSQLAKVEISGGRLVLRQQ
ncbi:MAG TPA: TIGR02281 family clan AA aspartic protease [Methylovirgula sp.]|jgi:aspartyl protease family protein